MSAPIRTDAWEVTVDRAAHTYQALTEPDPAWEEVDEAGHVHTYDSRDETWEVNKIGEYWCPDCRAMHTETETVCTSCGDEVTPGVRPGRPRSVQGPARATGQVSEDADAFGVLVDAVRSGERVDEVRLSHAGGTVVLKTVLPTEFHTDTFGRRFVRFEAGGVSYVSEG